jgi:hypothetical protein
MTDTFNVTAALSPANPTTGQAITVTISGDDVHTVTSTGSISVTLHLEAADGATDDLVVTAPYQKITTTHESVKMVGVTDSTGRVWTVDAGGLKATAVA